MAEPDGEHMLFPHRKLLGQADHTEQVRETLIIKIQVSGSVFIAVDIPTTLKGTRCNFGNESGTARLRTYLPLISFGLSAHDYDLLLTHRKWLCPYINLI